MSNASIAKSKIKDIRKRMKVLEMRLIYYKGLLKKDMEYQTNYKGRCKNAKKGKLNKVE